MTRIYAASALLILTFFFADTGPAKTRGTVIEGLAIAIDGDTIEIAGVRLRLFGIAAPELSERHGKAAKAALAQILDGTPLLCATTGKQSYGREIGSCLTDNAVDIAAAMVASGYARDCPAFSRGKYAEHETDRSHSLPLPRYCRD